MLAPSWKRTLNYETEWTSRDEIADSTYEAAFELNRLKARYGLLLQRTADRIERRIEIEQQLMGEIDAICTSEEERACEESIEKLMREFDSVGPYTICSEDEMNWPTRFLRFDPLRVIQGALIGRK